MYKRDTEVKTEKETDHERQKAKTDFESQSAEQRNTEIHRETATENAGDREEDEGRHQKRLSGGQRSMGRYKTEIARDK